MVSGGTGDPPLDLGRASFAVVLTTLWFGISAATPAPGVELQLGILSGLTLMWAGYHWFRVCVPPPPSAKWAFDPTRWKRWLTAAIAMTLFHFFAASFVTYAQPQPSHGIDYGDCVWLTLTGFAWYRVLLPR